MTVFHIIGMALFGLVVGWIAEWLSPGKHPGGCIGTAIIGICGAELFQYLTRTFFNGWAESWHWIGAILGTILLLALYRLIFGKN